MDDLRHRLGLVLGDRTADSAKRLLDALAGVKGEDQQRIAEIGLDVVETLLRKNIDYGSSVFKRPVLAPECTPATGIRVRMSDKVERIQQLLEQEPEVRDESLGDSFADLAGYSILYLARPNRKEKKEYIRVPIPPDEPTSVADRFPVVDNPSGPKPPETPTELPGGLIPVFAKTTDGRPLDEDEARALTDHVNRDSILRGLQEIALDGETCGDLTKRLEDHPDNEGAKRLLDFVKASYFNHHFATPALSVADLIANLRRIEELPTQRGDEL